MVEKELHKSLYKIELITIKTIPYIIMFCYIVNSILSYFCIDTILPSLIGGLSILPWLFLFISSFVFRFCVYHRLPLYYVLIEDAINYYDNIIGIPISNRTLLLLHLILAGIFILIIVFIKFRQHEQRTS